MVALVSHSTKAALCVGLLVGTSDDGRVIVGGNDPLRRAQHIDGYDLQLGSDVFGRDPAAGRDREVPRDWSDTRLRTTRKSPVLRTAGQTPDSFKQQAVRRR